MIISKDRAQIQKRNGPATAVQYKSGAYASLAAAQAAAAIANE